MTKEELIKKIDELKIIIEKEDIYRKYRPVQAYCASFSAVVYDYYFQLRTVENIDDIKDLAKEYIELYLKNFISVLLAENLIENFKNFIENNFDTIEAKELDLMEYWLLTQRITSIEKKFDLFLKQLKFLNKKFNK